MKNINKFKNLSDKTLGLRISYFEKEKYPNESNISERKRIKEKINTIAGNFDDVTFEDIDWDTDKSFFGFIIKFRLTKDNSPDSLDFADKVLAEFNANGRRNIGLWDIEIY